MQIVPEKTVLDAQTAIADAHQLSAEVASRAIKRARSLVDELIACANLSTLSKTTRAEFHSLAALIDSQTTRLEARVS